MSENYQLKVKVPSTVPPGCHFILFLKRKKIKNKIMYYCNWLAQVQPLGFNILIGWHQVKMICQKKTNTNIVNYAYGLTEL